MSAYELELLGEFEDEFELEGEAESEYEWETQGEEFLPLAGLAARLLKSPAVRNVASRAAKSVMSGLLGEEEYELEGEFEWEYELNPVRRVYADAMMEHLGHLAAEAEDPEAAEHFLPFLLPLAAKALPLAAKALPMASKLLPKAASLIARFGPKLSKGIGSVVRNLASHPQAKPLIRTVPGIVKGTVRNIAQQVAQGRPVTVENAVRALARNTANTLNNEERARAAIRRSQMLDRRFHQMVRPGHRAVSRIA